MEEKKVVTTDQLREAFYHVEDIFGRCLIQYCLLGETGRALYEEADLKGNKIELGIRAAEYGIGNRSTLLTLVKGDVLHLGIDNFEESDKGLKWNFKGVPIEVKIIKRKYEFLENPESVYYFGEYYKVPNPFNKYYQARFIVQ